MAATSFSFGKVVINPSIVFLQSRLSYAITNIKPVVPGHILVVSKRVVPRFHDLTSDEVSDMFCCVHRISPLLQQQYNATSLTIAIQDGKEAGQTMEHVHVHMLPRRVGDFERNDDVYEKLQDHDAIDSHSELRSESEMIKESEELRKLFTTDN